MVTKYKKNKYDNKNPSFQNSGKLWEMDIEDNLDEPEDQARTIAAKQKFLKLFPLCRLIVSLTAKETGIALNTFYHWYDNDKEFAEKIDKARVHTNQRVRDLLMKKIVIEEETRAITYYLDRKDPEFKPTSKTEVVTGSKTLEDILKSDEDKTNANTTNTEGVHTEGGAVSPGPEVPAGEPIQDKGQTGETPTVPPEQNTTVLLEKKDKEKSNSEGAPEGDQQGDRRRPIDRLRTKRN